MTEDKYTRAERSTEFELARRKWEKRYKAIVDRCGLCHVCIHRDRGQTFWGRNICRVGQQRQYPQCQTDGKGVQFQPDAEVVDKLKEAA